MSEPEQVTGQGGAVFLTPPTMPEGEQAPPMGLLPVIALTEPDAAGRIWVVLQITDDTVSNQYRIPWQVAGQLGQHIASQLAQAAQVAQAKSGPTLFVPGVNMPEGPLPPMNGYNHHP